MGSAHQHSQGYSWWAQPTLHFYGGEEGKKFSHTYLTRNLRREDLVVAEHAPAQAQSSDSSPRHLIERYLDRTYLIETLCTLARVPTDVPLGYQTLMEPDDPKLVHYVQ